MLTLRIGILNTDDVRPELAGEFGQYPDMFMRLLRQADADLEFVTYDTHRGEYPTSLDDVDGFLITGSKASVYENKDWIRALQAFVVRLHERHKPLVGICFGHQLVAQALGGKTEKAAVGWGVGVHGARFIDKPPWLISAPDEFQLLVSHQDQVTRTAPGTRILAGSEFCPVAMCQVDDHILTFQGHPEFQRDYSRALIELRKEVIGDAVHDRGLASLSEPTDEKRIARWIVEFLRSRIAAGKTRDH